MPRIHSQSESIISISRLDQLIAEVSSRLGAGEPVDIAALTADCPQLREKLEILLPTLQAVVEFEHSFACADANVAPPIASQEHNSVVDFTRSREGKFVAGVLGDFRIIREIGRGGMGVVFEAEQISLGRTVALKILPYAGVLDERQLQRFKNEARAAATLEHPNIVPVYSIGCERGVHYFAMRYIEGQSMAEVIAELGSQESRASSGITGSAPDSDDQASADRPLTSSPVPAQSSSRVPRSSALADTAHAFLSTFQSASDSDYLRNVARLGVQAAEALEFAHERGVLHRDIKPGNLLLDVHGDLWVADFGLARLEQDAGLTITGDVLGTLRYMSPEQALGQRAVLDERADVYSLGVTLYEMLVLRPAFSGRDRQEVLRRIASEEPQPPRQIDPRIPRDLETIVLKAMSKEVTSRYQTASQLADDLRRYLDHQPIQARRPTRAEKLVKWSRRHPSVVWATVLVLLATTITSAISSWQAIEATHAKQQAKTSEQQTKASEQIALKNARRADAISDFLINALRSPDPARDGRSVTIAEVLDRTAKEVQEEFADDERMQADLLNAIAKSYEGLGLYRESVLLFGKVQELRSSGQGPRDPATIEAMCNYAASYETAGQFDKAIPLYLGVLQIQKERLAADDPELLATTTKLAWAYNKTGEVGKALSLFQDVLRLAQAKVKSSGSLSVEFPAVNEKRAERGGSKSVKPLIEDTFEHLNNTSSDETNVLVALNNIAKQFAEAGQVDQAIPLYQQTLKAMQEKLAPDDDAILTCMYNLAMAYKVSRRFDDAIPMFVATLRLRKAKLGPDHPVTIATMTCLGATYLNVGRTAEAVVLYEEAFRLRKSKLGNDHPETMQLAYALAQALSLADRAAESIPLLEEALPVMKAKLGVAHPDTLALMRDLAEDYRVCERTDDALSMFRAAFDQCSESLGPDRPLSSGLMWDLTKLYQSLGRPDDVLSLKSQWLEVLKRRRGPDHPDVASAMIQLGDDYARAGKPEKAVPLGMQALKIRISASGKSHPDSVATLRFLVGWLQDQNKLDEAEFYLRDFLPPASEALTADAPEFGLVLAQLSATLLRERKYAEAEPFARQSLEMREKTSPDDWKTFNSRILLGSALLGQQKYADAEPLLIAGYEGLAEREAKLTASQQSYLRDAIQRLVELYEATNQTEKAAQRRKELKDFDARQAQHTTNNQPHPRLTSNH